MSFATHDWDIWSEPDCIRVQIEHEYHANGDMTISNVAPRERVLASEQVWRLPSEWNEKARGERQEVEEYNSHHRVGAETLRTEWQSPRIVTRNDLFAPFSGNWLDEAGKQIWWCRNCNRAGKDGSCGRCSDYADWMKTADVIARYFAAGPDACPNCEFVAVTDHPERVRENWPLQDWMKQNGGLYCDQKRDNFRLAVRVRTQPEANEQIPAALALRDLVGKVYVWAEPSEAIDMRPGAYCPTFFDAQEHEEVTAAMLRKNGWIGAADLLLTLRESIATQADRITELEAESERLRAVIKRLGFEPDNMPARFEPQADSTHTAKYTDPSEKLEREALESIGKEAEYKERLAAIMRLTEGKDGFLGIIHQTAKGE